jgi:hypothetical protein
MLFLKLSLCVVVIAVAMYLYHYYRIEYGIAEFFGKAKLAPYFVGEGDVYLHDELGTGTLPGYFKWKERVLVDVRDQGRCASCWAFAVTDCVADRLSILTGGVVRNNLSVQDLQCYYRRLFTCKRGGIPELAYHYVISNGLQTETDHPYEQFQSREVNKCKQDGNLLDYWFYNFNKIENNKHRVFGKRGSSKSLCYNLATLPEGSDLYLAALQKNIQNMKTEIMLNGPIVGTMFVRKDLYMYDGKTVYESAPDSRVMGGHAIEIFGWSEKGQNTSEPGFQDAYWICRNSWGTKWPKKLKYGLMYVKMGINESGIESRASCVEPVLNSATQVHHTKAIVEKQCYRSYEEYLNDPDRVNFITTDGIVQKM